MEMEGNYVDLNIGLTEPFCWCSIHSILGVFQGNRTSRLWIDMYIHIYYEELAHTIMKSKKSHDLPLGSWRFRKYCGII